MTVSVKVRLVGAFRVLSGRRQVTIKLGERPTIQDAIQKLVESYGPEFREALVDPVLGEPQPNALVLLNGREIGVLEGVETMIDDGDEIVLVPVIHGG